jgi:hypothetical protein
MCLALITTCSPHLSADGKCGSSARHLVQHELSHASPLKPRRYKPYRRAVRRAGEMSAARMFLSEDSEVQPGRNISIWLINSAFRSFRFHTFHTHEKLALSIASHTPAVSVPAGRRGPSNDSPYHSYICGHMIQALALYIVKTLTLFPCTHHSCYSGFYHLFVT